MKGHFLIILGTKNNDKRNEKVLLYMSIDIYNHFGLSNVPIFKGRSTNWLRLCLHVGLNPLIKWVVMANSQTFL